LKNKKIKKSKSAYGYPILDKVTLFLEIPFLGKVVLGHYLYTP